MQGFLPLVAFAVSYAAAATSTLFTRNPWWLFTLAVIAVVAVYGVGIHRTLSRRR